VPADRAAEPSGEAGAEGLTVHELHELLDAIVSVGGVLSLEVVLRRIVESAVGMVGARYGALGVLDESGDRLSQFLHVGLDPATADRIGPLPKGQGLLGQLIADPRPLRLDDLNTHENSFGFPPGHPPMTSFLGVPIRIRGEVFGNLYLTDKRGEAEFTAADEQMAVSLAAAAGMAIENARLHARVSDLVVVEDRERIARDLHDTVIQRIFATGLALQSVAVRVDDTDLADRLQLCVDDLDDTVRHIRTTIFELQRNRVPGRSLRREVIDLASELGETFGLIVGVAFDGPVDTLVAGIDSALADVVLAVVREAVTNVAKHAAARHVEVLVEASSALCVAVVDDGCGFDVATPHAGNGVANLRERAERLGGVLQLDSSPSGTTLRWVVPLR